MSDFDPNFKPVKQFSIVGQKVVISNDKNQILLLKRSEKSGAGGMWSFPGGGLEKGEDSIKGIQREIKEETKLTVKNLKPFHVRTYLNKENDSVVIIAYYASYVKGDVVLNWEHDEYKWVTKEEALRINLTPDAQNILAQWKSDPIFIKELLPKEKVYKMWLSQLEKIEQSTISSSVEDNDLAIENSMAIGFKLFPLIDSVALNLLGKLSGRKYLEALGYSEKESYMLNAMFRNGILHTTSPYTFKYKDGEISWGLMSSSGSSGFVPHYSGYSSPDNPEFDSPADKAFTYHKLGDKKLQRFTKNYSIHFKASVR